jgi:Protein of unknown function (DUF3631)
MSDDRANWMGEAPPDRTHYASAGIGGEGVCEQIDEAERLASEKEKMLADAVERLAKLSRQRYEQCRQEEAKALGVRASILDDFVRMARAGDEDADQLQGEKLERIMPDPWPDPVILADLLSRLADYFARYAVLPNGGPCACAEWTVHTYVYDVFDISPKLWINAPTRDSGKTRMLELLGLVVAHPLACASVKPASLFRAISLLKPTMLLDEVDGYFKAGASDQADELRTILNASHSRTTGYVIRSVGEDHEVRRFHVFAPVAMAGIGAIPGTLASRSISIRMRRALPRERPPRITKKTRQEAEVLARKCVRWAQDNRDKLDPDRDPTTWADELFNRAGDNWRVLCSIADLAGGIWPKLTVDAVRALSPPDDDAETIAEKLLHDLEAVWPRTGLDPDRREKEATSEDLVGLLVALEGRPWAEMGKARKALTKNRLATLLEVFKVRPGFLGPKDARKRGYRLADLADAFGRHPKP